MTSFFKIIAAGAAALAFAGATQASTVELTFTGIGISGDVLAWTDSANHITSISGSLTDSTLSPSSFTVTGLSGYAAADNQLTPTPNYVTFAGLSFSTDAGTGWDFNIYDNGGGNYSLLTQSSNPGGGAVPSNIALAVTAVPEPANAALLLAGVLGLGAVARRRAATR
jgi:hypothetical protein